MAGTLYIVATPIGNLDDMPPRVAATFGAADFIAAEDTRVTMKLLNFLGLKKPMVSYYEHALQKGEGILRRIEAGEIRTLCFRSQYGGILALVYPALRAGDILARRAGP